MVCNCGTLTELVNVHLKYLTHQLGSCKLNYSVISGALPAFVELGNRVLYEGAQEVCVERCCVVLEAEYVGAMTTAPLLLSCMFYNGDVLPQFPLSHCYFKRYKVCYIQGSEW